MHGYHIEHYASNGCYAYEQKLDSYIGYVLSSLINKFQQIIVKVYN